jgi:hypothetical protein
MSPSSIQTFLASKNSKLATLKVTEKSTTEILDYYPNYNKTVPVSQAIYDAAQVYGINPEAIMATLQKEQSLITDTSPEDSQLRFAMGYGCPDSSGCSSAVAGLFYQIDNGTWAFRAHFERASGNTWWGKAPSTYPCKGTTRYYSPGLFPGTKESFYDESGTKIATFTIANAATAALYCYTPHPYNNPNGLYGLPVQGTTGDYYTGSYNFVRSFERWFGPTTAYSHMDQPRWMQLSVDLQKQYPGTGEVVDSVLTAGTQIYFSSKVTVNGVTYLRTQYDTTRNEDKGIPLTELDEIPYEDFLSPRWMQLTTSTPKYSPAGGNPEGLTFDKDTQLFFKSKISVNGSWYYRTEYDTTNNISLGIKASNLVDPVFVSLDRPRWMQVTQPTSTSNTGDLSSLGDSIAAGSQFFFDSKIFVNNSWYFRTSDQTSANSKLGITQSAIKDAPYVKLDTPRWMKLNATVQKQIPSTGTPIDSMVTGGTHLYFSSRVLINGVWYLRTQWDTDRNLDKGIPQTSLSDLTLDFVNLETPRYMKLKTNVYKVNPITGQPVDGLLAKDTKLFFATKALVGGVWYLRTQWDTDRNLDKAIPLSELSNI